MHRRRELLALVAGLAMAMAPGEGRASDEPGERDRPALRPHGGSPEQGRRIVQSLGCGACHRIPGVPNARGRVGPDLAGFPRRAYIAGRIPNTPGNLEAWLRNPPALEPATAMPSLGMDARQVRDVASFLYELD
jgi:cytochrome c2